MKAQLSNLLIILILLISFSIFSQSDYYYYQGEKVFLNTNYQYVNIVTGNSFDETQLVSIEVEPYTLHTETEMRNGEYKKIAKLEFSTTPATQAEYEQKISDLKNLSNMKEVYPYYSYNGYIFGAMNKIYIKLKQTNDLTLLQNSASQYNLDVINPIDYMPLWYEVSCNSNTQITPVDLSAILYESGLFAEADPSFSGRFYIPSQTNGEASTATNLDDCQGYGYTEPVKLNQWNFFNNPDSSLADINVCGAWDSGFFGEGVVVTIIDTGIQEGLSDLPVVANDVRDPSGVMTNNFYTTNTETPPHGTFVAGIIGANHDGELMGGVAPNADLIYVLSDFSNVFNDSDVIDGINWGFLKEVQRL